MITVYLRNLTMIFGNFHKKGDITQSLKNTPPPPPPPQMYPLGQKKKCVFTVTRPTLIFASDPMHFYTEFG